MIGKHPEILISYSWNDEGLRVADELERFFQAKGIAVMRDNLAIGYKGLIKEYMQRLGRGKCIILVLSDQYFKSPNCMYELLEIAKDQDFEKRVFPVPVEGFTYNNREKYVTYWDEQKTRLQEEIRQFLNLAHREGSINKLNLYEDIRCKISGLLERLSNLNTYPLQGGNYEPLLKAIQANMPQAELDYSRLPLDFSSKIEFLTQYFVGRQDAMAWIDEFIQSHSSGYLAIVGEAGIGKSALLAKLVKERGYLHHFVDDKQNSAKDEVFLRSIVGQLQQQYSFEFEERIPISVSEWNIYFHKWIKEISAEEQLVICVDALDEAQHYGGSDNLLKYLPQNLPENVYFILSSRPEFKKEDITFFNATVFERYDLPPFTQTDIEDYLAVRSSLLSEQVRNSRFSGKNLAEASTTSQISAILYQKSEGNPLYLHYLLQECENEHLTLEQVSQLPQGLTKFYEKQWRERIWIGDKTTKEGRKQILCLLLLLKEPVNEEMLLALTDFDRAELQDYLMPLRHFLRIGERYEFFHDSFKNFLQYQFEKSISLYHEKLIDHLWNWQILKGDLLKYTLFWLPKHLLEVRYIGRLADILLNFDFLNIKTNTFSIKHILNDFKLCDDIPLLTSSKLENVRLLRTGVETLTVYFEKIVTTNFFSLTNRITLYGDDYREFQDWFKDELEEYGKDPVGPSPIHWLDEGSGDFYHKTMIVWDTTTNEIAVFRRINDSKQDEITEYFKKGGSFVSCPYKEGLTVYKRFIELVRAWNYCRFAHFVGDCENLMNYNWYKCDLHKLCHFRSDMLLRSERTDS